MKNNLVYRILNAIRAIPAPERRMVLAMCAHTLAALACQKKSQEESGMLISLPEAWNSPMAKPMREYIDVWGADFQSITFDEVSLKIFCDRLMLVLQDKTNFRAAFYDCVQLLYVAQLWGKMGDVHFTASQLSKTAPEVVFEALTELEKEIPEEVAGKYKKIAEWNAKEFTKRFWTRLYGFPMEKREIRQSGKTTDGLALLEATGLDPEHKLQLFCCAKLGFFQKRKDPVENPFRYLRKVFSPDMTQLGTNAQGEAITVVREKDGAISLQSEYFSYESTFDQAIEVIKSIEPVRFFLAIEKYSLRRTELATELAVSVRPFLQKVHSASDFVILNPNPLAVELANKLDSVCLLAFQSLETAYLYLTQFPNLNFGYLDIEEHHGLYRLNTGIRSSPRGKRDNRSFFLESVELIQDALIFLRNGAHDQFRKVLSAFYPLLSEKSTLNLYTPNDVIVGDALVNLNFDLQSGTILPSYKEDSVPGVRKKYVLLTMKKRVETTANHQNVSLYKLIPITEDDATYLTYYPYTVDVPIDLLCENNGRGLNWLWNHYNLKNETTKQRKTREYRYSAEISLWYSWSLNSKGGRYYFCALPSQRQNNHNIINRGKRLTGFVQYRAKTEEAAVAAVAAGLERESFKQAIKYELEKLHKTTGMSFKSYYYCYRDDLAEKPAYNREIAELLFTSDLFDTLCTRTVYSLEDYQQVMDVFLSSISNKIVQLQYWEQLNLFLNYAERAAHIDGNPVRSFVYDAKEKDERYRAIRAGLAKKSFTMQEERTLLDYLKQELPENSLLQGCAIRFFTGMGVSEILALTWNDLNKLTFLDAGYLFVTKELKNKKINLYTADDSKVRLIPCCLQLFDYLRQRQGFVKELLQKTGIEIDDLPIVSVNNNDLTKCASVSQLRTATASFIEQLGISENKIRLPTKKRRREDDINDYHGELLRANFEYRATETCRMMPGEIAYILGRQPPDTFSRHYCDYGNIESQTILIRKLMRWDALRRRKEPPRLYYSEKCPITEVKTLILQGRTYDRPYLTELWLNTDIADSGFVQLEILDQSGADIEIFSED